jgi:hypothetical protein
MSLSPIKLGLVFFGWGVPALSRSCAPPGR